jgi:cytoplasmic tRNA 2-thiolation protein 1
MIWHPSPLHSAAGPGTFCGVFRRQALDRGAAQLGVDHIVTGHNADDIAETILMNSALRSFLDAERRSEARGWSDAPDPVMRGDVARLGRCTDIVTRGEDTIRRSKPFKYTYEKEIVMWVGAMVATLRVRADPCCVAPGTLTSSDSITSRPSASTRPKVSPRDRFQGSALGLTSLSFPAYRGHARTFLKSLEALRPSAIIDIIKSGEDLVLSEVTRQKLKGQQTCLRCGYMASNELCVRRKDLAPARRGKEGLT